MMPSMFSGVSGLRNHQVRLNVIGNNLANINTIGYKYGRVTFSDMMFQNLKSASAPQDGRGGINPQQVGLGMAVSSIDSIQTPGNLESTGRTTDLAIQGDGFFVLGDGVNQWYTRAGAFDLNGALVNPGNGLFVLGWQANNGVVDTSGALSKVEIPLGEKMMAQATTNATYVGNLNAAGNLVMGTVTGSNGLLAAAKSATLLSALKNDAGNNLGVQAGDGVAIAGSVGGSAFNGTLTVGAGTTLADLAAQAQTLIRAASGGDETVTVQADGTLAVTTDGGNITGLQLSISGNSVFNNAFDFADIAHPGTGSSTALRTAAAGTDTLVGLYNESGQSLGLAAGDDVTLLSAVVKGALKSNVSVLADITAATTLEDYRAGLSAALFGSFPASGEGIALEADGSFRISGAPGADNAVTAIELGAGPAAGDDTRSIFKVAQTYSETQEAKDAASCRISTQVYDSQGTAHDMSVSFTKTATNTWSWDAEWKNTSVGSGTIVFNSNGTVASTVGTISIPLSNGAATPLNITPDFSSLNQLEGDYTVSMRSQDGYPMGSLNKYEISANGQITGIFTNGLNQLLGQIAVARFANAGGLTREGQNLYSQSTNSGIAQVGPAGVAGRGQIAVGNLEMSNVDIASEFTSMIISERGFQANSKVITTSDEMLQELVNLKR